MMRAAPGGPFSMDRKLEPAIEQQILAKYGLDRPLHEQYVDYLSDVVRLDFGPSLRNKDRTVSELIAEGLPVSAMIGGLAMALAFIVGGGLGIIAGLRQNSALDYTLMGFATLGISVPSYVVGPVAALIFGVWFPIFSAGGLDIGFTFWERMTPYALTLPVITLSLYYIAGISRIMRGSMIEAMRSNHIRTARSKGASERDVVLKHALPIAVLPLISYIGPASVGVVTGSLVIERVFSLPGIGSFFIEGALNRDYTLVMGVVVLFATLILLMNLIADVLYAILDPRVKY
ncbi:MAG: oligopeptide transporter permease [Ponticaulis sp.]|nr:oligopeptide transporter permease [Ponticaulis sp.]